MLKDTIAISAFKARCVAVLKQVQETGRPIVVTEFGKAVAEIVPATSAHPTGPGLGTLTGHATITGDIMAPVADPSAWEAAGV